MQCQFETLTDTQKAIIQKYIPKRKRKYDVLWIFEAILWIVRTGSQWRNLDSKYDNWSIVYYYYRVWNKTGIFQAINSALVEHERAQLGKSKKASVAAIDSQSVKIAPFISEEKGIDGGKKINGRKRHIVTDHRGVILAVLVSAANSYDGNQGVKLYELFKEELSGINYFFADNNYKGAFKRVIEKQGAQLIIAARPEGSKGFVPLAIRWVVERTFGWFNFFRRLDKDRERKIENSAIMIILAQIQILLNRIHRNSKLNF